ncbi:MAG TPA: PqqD family protein [Acidobacteriota bacterium]|nr:PqqD family protein [Acidobacteriota bacterium]
MNSESEEIVKSDDLVTRRIAGETLIVPVRKGVGDLDSIFTLNEAGSFIWDLIGQGIRFDQIVESLCREYEVTVEDAAKDVKDFLESLELAGLIRFLPDSPD